MWGEMGPAALHCAVCGGSKHPKPTRSPAMLVFAAVSGALTVWCLGLRVPRNVLVSDVLPSIALDQHAIASNTATVRPRLLCHCCMHGRSKQPGQQNFAFAIVGPEATFSRPVAAAWSWHSSCIFLMHSGWRPSALFSIRWRDPQGHCHHRDPLQRHLEGLCCQPQHRAPPWQRQAAGGNGEGRPLFHLQGAQGGDERVPPPQGGVRL